MLETFTSATFAKGDVFQLRLEDGQAFQLVLVDIREGKNKMPEAARDPFSLVFTHPKAVWFPQGNYRLEHPKVGQFELCLVPVLAKAGDTENHFYEAGLS